jgi:thioredoxin reductase
MFRCMPAEARLMLVRRVLGPLGAWWLRERVEGKLPVLQGHRVTGVRAEGAEIVLTVASGAGSRELAVDHVIAATGYRVDLRRLDFLAPQLRDQVRCVGGWPHLTGSFESSVPGLFFISLTAAETFGPVMRFVCGAGFAARRVTRAVAARVKDAKGENAGADLGHPA